MAGHSHFKSIKHHKAAIDAKRSKHFSKFSKALMVAAREGGGDPAMNLSLGYAIDRARAGNMSNEAIDRAIKRATNELGERVFEDIAYEGYGPGGVAFIVECTTDNRNRTAPDLRKIFSVNGGNLGTPNSVLFSFDRKGLVGVPLEAVSEDDLLEVTLEAGAEDMQKGEDQYQITTPATAFDAVKKALKARGWELTTAELAWVPQNTITPDKETAERVQGLITALEDYDDVQNVHSNFAPPDDA